jgi:hypothetical protein
VSCWLIAFAVSGAERTVHWQMAPAAERFGGFDAGETVALFVGVHESLSRPPSGATYDRVAAFLETDSPERYQRDLTERAEELGVSRALRKPLSAYVVHVDAPSPPSFGAPAAGAPEQGEVLPSAVPGPERGQGVSVSPAPEDGGSAFGERFWHWLDRHLLELFSGLGTVALVSLLGWLAARRRRLQSVLPRTASSEPSRPSPQPQDTEERRGQRTSGSSVSGSTETHTARRGVHIGGNATRNTIVTGDNNRLDSGNGHG